MRLALFFTLLMGVSAAAEERQKHFRLISVEFNNTDVRIVMRVLAEMKQLSVVIAPDVSGTVNVKLRDVTWETALHAIARLEELRYEIHPPIMYIKTL